MVWVFAGRCVEVVTSTRVGVCVFVEIDVGYGVDPLEDVDSMVANGYGATSEAWTRGIDSLDEGAVGF
jgi:hypothetical protein